MYNFSDDPHFAKLIQDTETAIENGIFPERISQGSSGSYFCKNPDGVSYSLVFFFFAIVALLLRVKIVLLTALCISCEKNFLSLCF